MFQRNYTIVILMYFSAVHTFFFSIHFLENKILQDLTSSCTSVCRMSNACQLPINLLFTKQHASSFAVPFLIRCPVPHSLSRSSFAVPFLIRCPVPHSLSRSSFAVPFLIRCPVPHSLSRSSFAVPFLICCPVPHLLSRSSFDASQIDSPSFKNSLKDLFHLCISWKLVQL